MGGRLAIFLESVFNFIELIIIYPDAIIFTESSQIKGGAQYLVRFMGCIDGIIYLLETINACFAFLLVDVGNFMEISGSDILECNCFSNKIIDLYFNFYYWFNLQFNFEGDYFYLGDRPYTDYCDFQGYSDEATGDVV